MKWLLFALLFACGQPAQPLRIGYQKSGALFLLKARATFQDAVWVEFQAGAPLMEALRADAIDFGYVGETPPVFAQAGDVPFVYVASEPPAPKGEAIVVREGVSELRGRKVAVQRGSNAHYLLLRAAPDAEAVYLGPADARSAFEAGHVEAWAIWDPYFAVAEQRGARVLRDGEGLVQNQFFYVASRAYAQKQPARVRALLAELRDLSAWANTHPEEAAHLLADASGLPLDALLAAQRRHTYGVRAISDALLAAQQEIADAFLAAGLIPRAIRVRDAAPASPVYEAAR